MARQTVAELLKEAKKGRDKIQEKAISDVEKLIPPIFGPAGRAGPNIARGIVEVENMIMDYAIDRMSDEIGHLPVGPPGRPKTATRPPTMPGPTEDGGFFTPEQAAEWDRKAAASPSLARKRSDKQLVNDQILRNELKTVNGRARKKNGQFKKGWDQRRVMRLAQKECTRERHRLGLCEKPKKKRRRRGKSSR